MALIGTPASSTFDVNQRIMILNVNEACARIEWVKDALSDAGIGSVQCVFVSGPFDNGMYRIEVVLDWYNTAMARRWQATIMDPTLRAQLSASFKNTWILIPVPNSYTNNQLWQEDLGNKTPTWYKNNEPESEVLSLENMSESTRAAATLLLTETDTADECFGYKNNNKNKNNESAPRTPEHVALTMY